MAKLPTTKKILREDLKDAPGWIDRLLSPLNSFMDSIYYALDKNITFTENIACTIKKVEFTTLPTYGTGNLTDHWQVQRFTHNLKNKPFGISLEKVEQKSNTYAVITNPVFIDWSEGNGIITLNYVTGLEPSSTYILTLLVK
jgi:hypothetical protein